MTNAGSKHCQQSTEQALLLEYEESIQSFSQGYLIQFVQESGPYSSMPPHSSIQGCLKLMGLPTWVYHLMGLPIWVHQLMGYLQMIRWYIAKQVWSKQSWSHVYGDYRWNVLYDGDDSIRGTRQTIFGKECISIFVRKRIYFLCICFSNICSSLASQLGSKCPIIGQYWRPADQGM